MELKSWITHLLGSTFGSSNCTFMELKLAKDEPVVFSNYSFKLYLYGIEIKMAAVNEH